MVRSRVQPVEALPAVGFRFGGGELWEGEVVDCGEDILIQDKDRQERYLKSQCMRWMSDKGRIVWTVQAEAGVVARAEEMAGLAENIAFAALNQPTSRADDGVEGLVAKYAPIVTLLLVLLMAVWVHSASGDASAAHAAVQAQSAALVKMQTVLDGMQKAQGK